MLAKIVNLILGTKTPAQHVDELRIEADDPRSLGDKEDGRPTGLGERKR